MAFTTVLSIGDEVLLDTVKHTVESVEATSFQCSSPVDLKVVYPGRQQFSLRLKETLDNFTDETLTFSYNLARILEDSGSSRSAMELYVELLKTHPSFIECYLRLSIISGEQAKYDDSTMWLSRAMAVSEEDPDINICLADLYNRSNLIDDAKRVYEKILKDNRNRKDSRSMTCLGNYNYSLYCNGNNADVAARNLDNSYKFFHQVLNEDRRNTYAANGLGIVCAEKGEVEAAKDIILKAQEANMSVSEDINTNLAHIYLMQNRHLDAERLYQVTHNNISKSCRSGNSDTSPYLMECTAYAQFRQQNRDEDAATSLMRAIHLQPHNIQYWYNTALVCETYALSSINKQAKVEAEILTATSYLNFAKDIFSYLSGLVLDKKKCPFDKKNAKQHEMLCKANVSVFDEHLASAIDEQRRKLEDRRKYDEEHNFRLRLKQEEKDRLEQEKDSQKKATKEAAELKEKKLQELQAQWVAAPLPKEKVPRAPKDARQSRSKKGSKKRKAYDEDEVGDDFFADDDDDLESIRDKGNVPDGEIDFGSDSDNDAPPVKAKESALLNSQLDTDLFGEDSDAEDAVPASNKRKHPREGESHSSPVKRLKKNSAATAIDSDEGGAVSEGEARTDGNAVSAKRKTVIQEDSDDDQ